MRCPYPVPRQNGAPPMGDPSFLLESPAATCTSPCLCPPAGQSVTVCWAGLPSLGNCPAEGTGHVGRRLEEGEEGEAPSRLHQLSLLHNCAGHCQGVGAALPRRSLCSSRGGEVGGGVGRRGRASDSQPGSPPTMSLFPRALHSWMALGVPLHLSNWHENLYPSHIRVQGTGWGWFLPPLPGSPQSLPT